MSSQPSVNLAFCCQVCETENEELRKIQRSLLPSGSLKGIGFEVASRFCPYANVGRDFAVYFQLPNGLVGLYVGDVVGKGLSAAMYAALVMGMFRAINKTGEGPASVLALLNKRLLVRPAPGRYAATLYALFNPATLKLSFSNTGLPFPLHASEDGCQQPGHGGLPSGLFPGSSYDLHTIQSAPGDSILFATDGLHELRDARDEDFSWGKLADLWREWGKHQAVESLDSLFDGVTEFVLDGKLTDDITTVVLKVPRSEEICAEACPARAREQLPADPLLVCAE